MRRSNPVRIIARRETKAKLTAIGKEFKLLELFFNNKPHQGRRRVIWHKG